MTDVLPTAPLRLKCSNRHCSAHRSLAHLRVLCPVRLERRPTVTWGCPSDNDDARTVSYS